MSADAVRQDADHGWPPLSRELAQLDPDFAAAYRRFSEMPERLGALDEETRELVNVAINISVTTSNAAGARRHVAAALDGGASVEDLVEVCELVFMVGIHSVLMAGPILLEELQASGQSMLAADEAERAVVSERYVASRGNLPPPFEAVLGAHPAFVDAYREVSSVPVQRGALDPKTRELIILALDAVTTHLHPIGTRAHIRAALAYGARGEEILEVLEQVSTIGVHGTNVGAELLAAELSRRSGGDL